VQAVGLTLLNQKLTPIALTGVQSIEEKYHVIHAGILDVLLRQRKPVMELIQVDFLLFPGGARNSNGGFGGVGENGYWWSSSNSNMDDAWYRYLSFDSGTITRYDSNKKLGLSIRCLRD
jgi:uncharacterized protein (TIGR02145 family)